MSLFASVPVDAPVLPVLALWCIVLGFAIFNVVTGRFFWLSLFAVPVGFGALFCIAIASAQLSHIVGAEPLAEFAQAFAPSKVKGLDIILGGLLILVAFGFSKLEEAINNLASQIAGRRPAH
eukprot:TRINITY_DN18773_c0_g1_i1.p1 TRINITY_DN18773_c0_g1~~TRINITY_DN18773_c0_g1_i1.p1  ORF type:complete len:122 (+),score=20.97 TRINITY_DN18773_c0_g1_i1:52-417(+)